MKRDSSDTSDRGLAKDDLARKKEKESSAGASDRKNQRMQPNTGHLPAEEFPKPKRPTKELFKDTLDF